MDQQLRAESSNSHTATSMRAFRRGCTIGEVLDRLKSSRSSLALQNVPATALSFLVSQLSQKHRRPYLVILPTDREAEACAEEIEFLAGRKPPRYDHPLEDVLRKFQSRSGYKAQRLGKTEIISERIASLYAIRNSTMPLVLVTSVLALLERLPPIGALLDQSEYLVVGEEISLGDLCRRLTMRGYYPVSLVEEYGDMSRRGGVLDVHAPMYKWPVRFEFFGDELESIRLFHPSSQRSMGTMEDAILLPASEIILDEEARKRATDALWADVKRERLTPATAKAWVEKLEEGHQLATLEPVLPAFYENLAGLWDYLDKDAILIWSDLPRIQKAMHEAYGAAVEEWERRQAGTDWRSPPSELLLDPESLVDRLQPYQQIWCNTLDLPAANATKLDLGVNGQEELRAAVKSHPARERLLEPLAERVRAWQHDGLTCHLICNHKERARRYVELLRHYGLGATGRKRFEGGLEDLTEISIYAGPVRKGFVWPAESQVVVCDEEIFGKIQPRRHRKKSVEGLFLNSFQDLQAGDYVVHLDHGIGIYQGLVHLSVGELESDFLHLEYQERDKLYVPVERLQKVQKYLGIEGQDPVVDKLGGKSWETAKNKARESAERVAQELLKMYAQRQVQEGHRFSIPDNLFREFETTFTFDETDDQLQAIEDVLDDMTSSTPMDRLICGDVGYGKTEVALRAAFKAIMDGKQVAMLVPTTVLAEQHYQTCLERFEKFPIIVEVLSRFKTVKQQREIVAGLGRGAIDMVIGTHRLLQNDVEFRDLGLLIVDEEHRFGVKHKEKLKSLRVSVDVLTLTATPIPRTLHMAMSGIRDLSTIETPPQDRRAIETYVGNYDDVTIKEAVYRELKRGGQIFFVHNHVQSIARMAAQLRKLVPEAKIGVAHGQMKERQLEKIMLDFVQRRIDILVCTTIIESGLDIPAANTIIINRADKLGLAQIYQLRGRVGRSSEQAYAHLLIPGGHLVTRDAQKRLRALMDFSELGAGFRIALNDLQIRGGGTILGAQQSGHISAVGYELYLELLEKTVRKLKGEEPGEQSVEPEITVPISAFLPETFIADSDQRLLAYKRLATVTEETDVDDLAREWRDRYGPLTDPVKALLILAKIRILLTLLGVSRLEMDTSQFVLFFVQPLDERAVVQVLRDEKCFAQLSDPDRLTLEMSGRGVLRRLAGLKRILQKLCEHDRAIKSIQ